MSNCDSRTGYGVLLFYSVQGSIAAERVLSAAAIKHKLIAVPAHLSHNCGFCVEFRWSDRDRVKNLVSGAALGLERIVPL